MSSTSAQTFGANHLPVLTIRTSSGETKTLLKPDENAPPKIPQRTNGVDLPRTSKLSITYTNAFNILCGAVVVDVQLHAILGSMNRVTGRMTLPKTSQKFRDYESLDYVAWTAVVDQTGYYACANWFFTDHSTALKVRPGHVAGPFAVQQRFNECGTLDIIFWFAMQGSANDPNRGYPNHPPPLRSNRCHELGEDFDETWCYGYEEGVKKFTDDDRDIVKRCLGLAYGGPDRWRTVERRLRRKLGFGLSEEQRVEDAFDSP